PIDSPFKKIDRPSLINRVIRRKIDFTINSNYISHIISNWWRNRYRIEICIRFDEYPKILTNHCLLYGNISNQVWVCFRRIIRNSLYEQISFFSVNRYITNKLRTNFLLKVQHIGKGFLCRSRNRANQQQK